MSLSKNFFSRHLSPDKTRKSHLDFPKTKADIIKDSKCFSEAAYRLAKDEFYSRIDATVIEAWEKDKGMQHQNESVARFMAEDMKRFHDEYPEFEKRLKSSLWF